jgi:porin
VVTLAATSARADVITPHLLYNIATISNLSGGAKVGTVGVGAAHLQMLVNGAPLGAPDFSVFVDGLVTHGGAPDGLVGDAQGVSNIAASPARRLYEGWVQYAQGGFSVLAGKYDLNSEFYRLSSAGLFLNSSFGIGPEYALSGVAGPSIFPDPSLGLRFAYKPTDDVVLRVAVLNERAPDQAGSDGALVIGEFAVLERTADSLPPGQSRARVGRNAGLPAYENKLALGVWYDSKGNPDPLFPNVNHHAAGVYLIGDRMFGSLAGGTLTGFFQLGVSDGRVGRFGAYFGGGLTVVGMVPGRPNDEIGVAFARAENGAHYRALQQSLPGLADTNAETTVEASYLAQVTDWLALQPDLQLVLNPNTTRGHALVFQFEAEISL